MRILGEGSRPGVYGAGSCYQNGRLIKNVLLPGAPYIPSNTLVINLKFNPICVIVRSEGILDVFGGNAQGKKTDALNIANTSE